MANSTKKDFDKLLTDSGAIDTAGTWARMYPKEIQTPYGKLWVKVDLTTKRGESAVDSVFMRVECPKALPIITGSPACNQYSGKWNIHGYRPYRVNLLIELSQRLRGVLK